MTEQKHTPATERTLTFSKRSFRERCGCYITEYGNSYEVTMCAMHGAAKELLEAAEEARDWFREWGKPGQGMILHALETAIRKARGEE